MIATRPTIADFRVGQPCSVPFVARFLGCSPETVRNMIRRGHLKTLRTNAFAADAGVSSRHVIDGGEILRFYGMKLLERDREKVAVPAKGSAKARAAKRIRELELTQ